MSPVLPDETIDAIAEVGAVAFAVWCKLLVHRNRKTGECFPSVKTIMKATGLTKPTVVKAIKELEKAGWLTVVRTKSERGKPQPNRYTLAPRLLVNEIDQQQSTHPLLVGKADLPVGKGNLPTVGKGNLPEPQEDRTPRIEPQDMSMDMFDEWYGQYPKKVKPARARKAYQDALKTIGGDREQAHQKLMTAVKMFSQSDIAKGDRQFIPHPTTWLNDARYNDDPKEWSKHNGNGKSKHTPGPGQLHPDDIRPAGVF